MTRKIFFAGVLSSMLLLSFPAIVIAQEDEESVQTFETTQSTEANSGEGRSSEVLEDRINRIKENASQRVAEAEQRRIENRCENAQQRINNLRTRLSDVIEKRREAYQNTSTRIEELSQKLKAAGVDTTELDLAISEMQTVLVEARNSVDSYMQNLADMTEMECTVDGEGFKLLLEDARAKRAEILSTQLSIKTIKDEQLKPALEEIRQSLASLNTQEGEE
jgi:hypothetical protein